MNDLIKKYTRFDGNYTEGIGSILQSQLHLYAYCRINGYYPNLIKLSNISHFQYTNKDSKQYDESFNNFFSFFKTSDIDGDYIDPNWLIRDWGEKNNDKKKQYINELSDKIIYTDKNYFNKDKKTVSVHIRSINQEDVCNNPNREYYSDLKQKYFVNLINNINYIHGDNLDIHIFSQGEENSFKIFKEKFNCNLHINDNIINTLYHLINSDILVTSNSSLSWCAHLFGVNEFVYSRDNFFHSWYQSTIKVNINGDIIK
jgi:hypothetical protein